MKKMKKVLSILLCLCMLAQNCPVVAFAAAEDNLCAHHPEHTADCGYDEAAGQDCAYHCHICHVQSEVDALPDEVTTESAEAVAAQLTAIDKEKASLSDEELAQVDFAKYIAAAEATRAIYVDVSGLRYSSCVFFDAQENELSTNADTYDGDSDVWSCGHPSYGEGKCTLCGEACPGHTGGEATCNKQAVCTVCGASYGELNTSVHTTPETYDYENLGNGKHSVLYDCCKADTGFFPRFHSYDAETKKCVCGLEQPPSVHWVVKNPITGEDESYSELVEIGAGYTPPSGYDIYNAYDLAGWYTEPNGKGTLFTGGYMDNTGDKTYYAHYVEASGSGGSGGGVGVLHMISVVTNSDNPEILTRFTAAPGDSLADIAAIMTALVNTPSYGITKANHTFADITFYTDTTCTTLYNGTTVPDDLAVCAVMNWKCASLTKHDETGDSCTEGGVSAYWSCSCGKYYSDAEGINLIKDLDAWKEGDGKISGHNYVNGVCSRCGDICSHIGNETPDDKNCTTASICSVCKTELTPANASHTPAEDDGDCTTDVLCANPGCQQIAIARKESHTPGDYTDNSENHSYTCTECTTSVPGDHDFSENGFCELCGGFEPATLNGDHYEIANGGQFFWFAQMINDGTEGPVDAVLTDDLDLEDREWIPIGTMFDPYSGMFNGSGHTISGLRLSQNTEFKQTGLFGFLSKAGIRNLTVSGSTAEDAGVNYAGILAAEMQDSILYNCYASGNLAPTGGLAVGGLVGVAMHSVIINCGSSVAVNSTASEVGGLVGYMTAGYDEPMCLLNSYCTGTVSGTNAGLVGYLADDAVNNYYSGGVLFGEVGNSITVNSTSQTFTPLIEKNYYIPGDTAAIGGAAEGLDTIGYAEAYTSAADLMNKLNGNLAQVEEIISGHRGYLETSDWAELVELLDGASVTASHWRLVNGAVVHCSGNTNKPTDAGNGKHSFICTDCKETITGDHAYENGKCVCGVYDLWVAGEQIRESHLTVTGDTGTATYDPATDTLTLNGFDNGDKSYGFTSNEYPCFAAVYTISDLNIVLVGENSLYVNTDSEGYKTSIQSSAGLTIGGEGSLDAGTENWCISAVNGMTITGGTLDIYGTTALDGSVTITGGNVSLSATDYVCYGTLTVNGGKVTLSVAGSNYIEGFGCTMVIGEGMAAYDENGHVIENPDFETLKYALIKEAHVHSWTYTAEGDTITAICNGTVGECPEAEQSITIYADGKTYDGTPVTATLDGSIDGVADPEIIYSGNTNAGTYTASITLGRATASVEFTIEKATVTVTADALTKTYGTDNPELTYRASGLFGSDTLTGALATTATRTSNVGAYDITVGSLAGSNYTIHFVGAKLTITKAAAPEIQWPIAAALTYGQKLSDSALTSQDENGTFAWQDGNTVPTVTNSGYAVVYTPKNTANYDYTGVALTKTIPVAVSKVSAIVTAAPTPNMLTYTGEPQKLINGGEATGGEMHYSTDNQNWSTTIPQGTAAGKYTVYYKVVGDANHSDTAADSVEVTIAKAKPVIDVDTTPITVTYGETVKLPKATTNFGTVVCDKTADDLVNAGTYTVTYTVAGTENFEGATKTLTVKVEQLAVAEPTVTGTYSYSGKELTAQLTGVESYMTVDSGNKGVCAGNYEVVITLDGNHKWAEGSDGKIQWSIDKAKAEISVNTDPITVTYGETVTLPTATTNFGDVVCNKKASDIVNAGTYTVTYTVAGTDNYDGDTKSITVTVNAKALTVTADALSKTYGDADPKLTYKVEGLVNGDELTGALSRETGENVDTYSIVQGNLAAGSNYAITFTGADFTISKRSVTITAKDQNIFYGTEISNTEIAANGLVDGHSVTATLTPSTTMLTENGTITASNAVIKANGADVTANYEISYEDGKLVIAFDTSVIDALEPETVKSDDQSNLEEILDTIDGLLEEEGLTEEQKKTLEDSKAKAEELLDVIESVQDDLNTENTEKVEDVTADNVRPEEKEALEDAKADLEKALKDNAGNYTEEEKQAIRNDIQRIEDAMVALENAEAVEEAIKDLPETVEPDDEDDVTDIEAAKKAYEELTTHEKSLIDKELREKLEALLDDAYDYNIIKGDGGKWTKGSSSGLSFTANGPFSKFVGIEVDDKEVDEQYYEAKSGSTIITLKKSFLKKLSTGKHTITVLYTDGETSGTFKILAASSNPATGDDSNIMLSGSVCAVSFMALAALFLKSRKHKQTK